MGPIGVTHDTGGAMSEIANTNAQGIRIKTEVEFAAPAAARGDAGIAVEIRDGNLFYGQKQALFDITMDIGERQVTAFIGPSGCGKSTLIRCLNRMNDLIDNVRIMGSFVVKGQD